MQRRLQLLLGEIPTDARHEPTLSGRHGLDRLAAAGGESDQGGTAMRRVRDEVDEARITGVIDHPLHELPAEILRSRDLRHGAFAFAAELVQDRSHTDRHPHDGLLALDEACCFAVQRSERNVDLRQSRGQGVRIEGAAHDLDYDTSVVVLHPL